MQFDTIDDQGTNIKAAIVNLTTGAILPTVIMGDVDFGFDVSSP